VNALQGFIGHRDREQTIWTPEFILDAVDLVFPDGWGDPFPSEGSPATRRAALRNPTPRDGFDAGSWFDRNFVNPPYAELSQVLPLACELRAAYNIQSIQLVPVRTRREWWCRYVRGASVAYLKPLVFLDAKTGKPYECVNKRTGKATVSQFPENLAAVYWGDRLDKFAAAFAPLAHHVQEKF
jgi:hypothetical protein